MKVNIRILAAMILLCIVGLIAVNAEYSLSKIKSKIIQSSVDDNSPGSPTAGTYPLILLHGFNPTYSSRLSEYSLKEMQNRLSADLGYVNKGLFTSTTTCAELRYNSNPIVVRATYFGQSDILQIDDYSQNVDKIISRVIYCTGANKVDIVTHSMGGIVVRNYIKNINSSLVRNLIMLGTPNHGGLYNVGEIADYLVKNGESRINLDFVELSENHDFMQILNSGNETIEGIKYYTIAGNVDGKGDNLVLLESVSLAGEDGHRVVPCKHFWMKYPSKCQEAYDYIKEILSL